MPGTSQSDHSFSISTPATLAKDKLLFHQMNGVERVSQPFEYSVSVLCENGQLDADKILGQGITVTCVERDGAKRYFHGWWPSLPRWDTSIASTNTTSCCGPGSGS